VFQGFTVGGMEFVNARIRVPILDNVQPGESGAPLAKPLRKKGATILKKKSPAILKKRT
jgi:hypothetical protein